MAKELFNKNKSLKGIHSELMKHLESNSHVTFYGNGNIDFFIPENGHCSFWFDDLVETILEKVKNNDPEIIKFSMEKGIDLFEFQHKLRKQKPEDFK